MVGIVNVKTLLYELHLDENQPVGLHLKAPLFLEREMLLEIALQEMDIDLCLQKCALANHVIEQLIRLHLPKLPSGMGFATGTPLDQIVDALGNMVNTLSGHLGSTTLGLRPSDVSRFRSLIPQPLVSPMNKSSVQFVDHSKNRPSLEDAKFCVRYATDMALRFEQQWQ